MRDLSIEEIIEIIKEESKKEKIDKKPSNNPPIETKKTSFKTPNRIENKNSYSIGELCSYHDIDFIRNAYRALLKREADSEGLNKFLKDLRSGEKDKVQILSEIRFSDEGKRKNVEVVGLKSVYLKTRLYKLPLIGYFLKWSAILVKLPKLVKRVNEFEAYTNARFLDIEAKHGHFFKVFEEIEANIKRLYKNSEDYYGFKEYILQQEKKDKENLELRIKTLHSLFSNEIKKYEEALRSYGKILKDIETKIEELRRENYEKIRYLEDAFISLNDEYKSFRDFTQKELKEIKEHSMQDFTEFQNFKDFILEEQKNLKENFYKEAEDYRGFKEYLTKELQDIVKEDKFDLLQMEIFKKNEDYYGFKSFVEDKLNGLHYTVSTKSNKEEIKRLIERLNEYKVYILDNQRRVSFILKELRKRAPKEISKEQIESVLKEEPHLLDSLYLFFEDRFRGVREDIKRRLHAYDSFLEKNDKIFKNALVLDIGCGRGEWLEVLNEKGFETIGVDINEIMVKECKERGLNAILSDALEFLRKQKDESFSLISGFHIIEHLEFKFLVELLDEIFRVLKPGGAVLFETPNPINIEVGTSEFYIDPSHKNPIHPKTGSFLIESRGFVDTGYFFVEHKEFGSSLKSPKEYDLKTFEDFIKIPKDYALIGYKA